VVRLYPHGLEAMARKLLLVQVARIQMGVGDEEAVDVAEEDATMSQDLAEVGVETQVEAPAAEGDKEEGVNDASTTKVSFHF
jgi:hypothetical protein